MRTRARRRRGETWVLSMALLLLTSAALSGTLSGCSDGEGTRSDQTTERSIPMSIELRSDAFAAGGVIPRRYSGDGEDLSPPLAWSGVPADAEELALIVDDPDASPSKPWVHWVMYKIPPTLEGLPEGVPATGVPVGVGGALQGPNDSGTVGYAGPAPPRGRGVHHYHFKLYALDSPLALTAGAGKKELLAVMAGHVLAQGELVGTYER